MNIITKIKNCFKRCDTTKNTKTYCTCDTQKEDKVLEVPYLMKKVIEEDNARKLKKNYCEARKEIGLYLLDIGKMNPTPNLARLLKNCIEEEIKANGVNAFQESFYMHSRELKIRTLELRLKNALEHISTLEKLIKENSNKK